MREQRLGMATFIPLTSIQTKPLDERLRQLDKGARLAIDIIQYPLHIHRLTTDHYSSFNPELFTFDSSLERALQYVCANTLVCDTLEIARRLSFEQGEKVKSMLISSVRHINGFQKIFVAVTLDGTVIHKNGLITGGKGGVHNKSQRWEEKEVESQSSPGIS